MPGILACCILNGFDLNQKQKKDLGDTLLGACSLGVITPRTSQGPMEHHGSPPAGGVPVTSGGVSLTAMRVPYMYACAAAYDTL